MFGNNSLFAISSARTVKGALHRQRGADPPPKKARSLKWRSLETAANRTAWKHVNSIGKTS